MFRPTRTLLPLAAVIALATAACSAGALTDPSLKHGADDPAGHQRQEPQPGDPRHGRGADDTQPDDRGTDSATAGTTVGTTGREAEPGDDRGGRGNEPGDDRGGRGNEPGDDHGQRHGGHGADDPAGHR